jgi:hypothetical protein
MSKKWWRIDTEEQLTCVRVKVQVLRMSRSNIEPVDVVCNSNPKTRNLEVKSKFRDRAWCRIMIRINEPD